MNRPVEANFFDQSHILNPFPFYDVIWRQEVPIARLPDSETYVVFSAELIREVCKRTADFSSDFGDQLIGQRAQDPDIRAVSDCGWPFAATLMIADPPRHTRTRKLTMAALEKRKIDDMAPTIRSLTVDRITRFIDKGTCEFVSEFAIPFPIIVIQNQIGLGHISIEKIKR